MLTSKALPFALSTYDPALLEICVAVCGNVIQIQWKSGIILNISFASLTT